MEEQEDSELVSLNLTDLGTHLSSGGKYGSSIPTVSKNIVGYAKQNLIIIFGRPEVGKSSLVAAEVAGWMQQGWRIDYYANEEPGRKIETIIQRAIKEKPDVIVLYQLDKMSMDGKYNNTADRLKALYERARVLAKTSDCLVVAVSQASADAENKAVVTYADLENSKTGKAGEADIIIGIGRRGEVSSERTQMRVITISKNKINGWLGSDSVLFDRHANQWSGE